MAKYTGMTFANILQHATIIAKKNRLEVEYMDAESVIDEALKAVIEDVFETNKTYSVAWPSNDQVDLDTANIMWPKSVFGDATPLQYIDYEGYRELFLGSESQKPTDDNNIYYSILDRTLYLEPDVTDFTNVVIVQIEREEAYSLSVADTEPTIPSEYRLCVSYKICEMLSSSSKRLLFEKLYRRERNRARSLKNRKIAEGGAEFYDPFAGSNSYRDTGWPGDID